MHISTLLICLVELVFFFYQLIYYLSRTSDKNRLYYLILLYLLIQYNIISDLFPDEQFTISSILQNIIVYFVAVIMTMYLPYYFYKVFHLEKLRFYAYWGSVWFLFIPFLLLFVTPYFLTGNLELSIKLLTIAPFFYSISFFYSLVRVIREKYKNNKDRGYKEEIIGAIAIWFWILLPVRAFFRHEIEIFLTPFFDFENRGTALIIILTNIGLLLLTILFVRQNIRQSKSEYLKLLESERRLQEMNANLLESERKLQEMNSDLMNKVKDRTLALELANEQRTNAFINLAHDLKTPLTLINNYIEDYIRETSPNFSLNLLQMNIGKLTNNIVNFFDSERIKKGITIYNHEEISDFSAILEENIALFQKYGAKKNIQLLSSIEKNVFILIDPEALNRIINNVIENAIKYTNAGGIIIINLIYDNDKIKFSVNDNGIGIPKELHNKVFDPYFQINSQKLNHQGMGLGLSIIKKIVDSIQGEIIINSEPDVKEGTEMVIYFNKFNQTENKPVSSFKNSSKIYEYIELNISDTVHWDKNLPTLLIVEDNIELLNYVGSKLKHYYNLYISKSGNEAIEKLKSIEYLDLIISDVMMDNGDGFEFYKNITQQKRFKHIPFIFLTAKTESKSIGLSLGAIDYIFKPFLIEELTQKIESVLNNLSEQRRAIIDSIHSSIINSSMTEQVPKTKETRLQENYIKYNLTSQEKRIIPLIEKGKSNREIAEILSISDKTVKKHMQNIFEKVEVTKKLELLNKLNL